MQVLTSNIDIMCENWRRKEKRKMTYRMFLKTPQKRTCRTRLKTYGKLSFLIFLTLYQHLGSKAAKFCVLWSISADVTRNIINITQPLSQVLYSARQEGWERTLGSRLRHHDSPTKETFVWLAVWFCSVQPPHRAWVNKDGCQSESPPSIVRSRWHVKVYKVWCLSLSL